MPKLGDISNVWSTIREISVSDIREGAEQPIEISIAGAPGLRSDVIRALQTGHSQYPSAARATIREYDVPLPRDRQNDVGRADLVLLVVDAHGRVSRDVATTADKLAILSVPCLVLLVGTEQVPEVEGDGPWYLSGVTPIFVPDTQPTTLLRILIPVLVDRLPDDLRIAAARRLPGLRDAVARWLIGDVSFSNASYALTSGIPEMIPMLNLPLNAADMLVLTKNQALLVYKLALAFGAPSDFQAQMREVLPVIGSGFMWRQVARQLVGLIPGFGILPKVAVSYAGTYATGQAAALWYRNGEALSQEALKRLYRQAMAIGRQRAQELLQRRKNNVIDVPPADDAPPAIGETKRLPAPPADDTTASNGSSPAAAADRSNDQPDDQPDRPGLRRSWPFNRDNS